MTRTDAWNRRLVQEDLPVEVDPADMNRSTSSMTVTGAWLVGRSTTTPAWLPGG